MSRCPTCGRRQKRSSDANRRYWAILYKMADHLRPNGEHYDAKAYHFYYKGKFLGCEDIRMPNGTTLTLPLSSADLDPSEFGDYMTKVEADAAERGIYLEE